MSPASASHEIIRPTLHHVGLTTANLEPMLAWYGKVLGMTLNHQSARPAGLRTPPGITAASVTNDAANHRIGKIIAARAAGMSVKELHRRAYAGGFPPAKAMDPRSLL